MVSNIRNTDVDVILETPHHLFVGEAKHEMSFGADGNLVLVHQLIRQYVMAQILVELCGGSGVKSVIPFVIGDNIDGIKKTAQVQFMIEQGWLKAGNILSWKEIESIALSSEN